MGARKVIPRFIGDTNTKSICCRRSNSRLSSKMNSWSEQQTRSSALQLREESGTARSSPTKSTAQCALGTVNKVSVHSDRVCRDGGGVRDESQRTDTGIGRVLIDQLCRTRMLGTGLLLTQLCDFSYLFRVVKTYLRFGE